MAQVFELISSGQLADAAAGAWPAAVLGEAAHVAKGCLFWHTKLRKTMLDVLPQLVTLDPAGAGLDPLVALDLLRPGRSSGACLTGTLRLVSLVPVPGTMPTQYRCSGSCPPNGLPQQHDRVLCH